MQLLFLMGWRIKMKMRYLQSAGRLRKLLYAVNSLMKVDELHLNGIKVYATEMTAQKNIYDCNFTEPSAFVMGGEEKVFTRIDEDGVMNKSNPMPGILKV